MSISPTLVQMQRAGFPAGAEPLVTLDLVDTVMTVTDPPTDLIADPARRAAWWRLEASRLPAGPVPEPAATRQLRAALRDLFDAHIEHRPPRATAVDDVNAVAASVPTSLRLVGSAPPFRAETRWHTEHGGNAALAAIAGEAIQLLTDPPRLQRLRRCANSACSMLFLAENNRRVWCASNLCGNRARVARHHQRRQGGR